METEACPHRPPCPGCPRFGERGVAPQALAPILRLARETGAALAAVEEGTALGHRHRARLMVRGRAASPKVGLFQAGTHRIVDTPRCRVHHPTINRVAAALKRAIRATGVAPYADAPHRGLVRVLQVVVERDNGRAQVVIVANEPRPVGSAPLLDALADELATEDALHSLWWNGNPERTNVLLGPTWQRHSGPEALIETIGGVHVFFPPGAFGQAHLALADRIVGAVHRLAAGAERVAEWYAGVGAFGLGLLGAGAEVVFNEVSPHGLEGLGSGIAALGPGAAGRARVVAGSAGDHPELARDRDLAIVDPPRRGLDAELVASLAARPPARLVYVSCNSASLERDARQLLAGGHLVLRSLVPFALFPFTEHVETLACFERCD